MQDKNHLKLDTQNFNRALTFWQALGFEIQKTRGPDGKRIPLNIALQPTHAVTPQPMGLGGA